VCFWDVSFVNTLLLVNHNNSSSILQAQPYCIAGTKIFAFVADDPDTLFQVVSCSGTTVVAGISISVYW
jgi:hypothetical protein